MLATGSIFPNIVEKYKLINQLGKKKTEQFFGSSPDHTAPKIGHGHGVMRTTLFFAFEN